MHIPLYNKSLSATVLAENSKIKLSKESVTKTFRNLEHAYLFYL